MAHKKESNTFHDICHAKKETIKRSKDSQVRYYISMKVFLMTAFLLLTAAPKAHSATYPVTDTAQTYCYDYSGEIVSCQGTGQDAAYNILPQSYVDNQDGTITDSNTGLQWTQAVTGPISYDQVVAAIPTSLSGYSDWRVPTMKELYTLSDFDGYTGRSEAENIPFVNELFEIVYGTTRFIDGQLWSSNEYVSTVMGDQSCHFGLNPIDGRIKCYGVNSEKYVFYVRDNENVGVNDFVMENSLVVTDQATGLQWMRQDSGSAMDWPTALEYCEQLQLDGASDWRLPNAHELQSIVDYSRSPDTTNSAALDSIFGATSIVNEAFQADFGWYWTSTTHLDGLTPGSSAAYIAFGRALGNMTSANGVSSVIDVHGAGAQRSDPKAGENQWPYGHGPQGDIVRINNLVRCVRGESSAVLEEESTEPTQATEPPTEPTNVICVGCQPRLGGGEGVVMKRNVPRGCSQRCVAIRRYEEMAGTGWECGTCS